MDVKTVPDLLRDALQRHRKADAFLVKREGHYEPVSLEAVLARARGLAGVLRSRGGGKGDRVAILSETRLEWVIADIALLSMGAITVPFYHTLPAGQIAPLLADSGCVGAFASSREEKAKLEQARSAAGVTLRWTWCFEEEALPAGAQGSDSARAADGISPDDLATIIYTSGTTGVPKGVMLTHGNFVAEAVISVKAMGVGSSDSYLSFLPLSHVFERCNGLYTMIHAGTTIAYAESIDRMPANLMEVRPTIVMAVPRFYEKMLDRATESATAGGGLKATLFQWSRRVAVAWATLKDARQPVPPVLAAQHALAGRLVYSKIAQRLGGRVRLRVSGGAKLNRDVALFFSGAGQPIHEGYGLSETSSAISVNRFGDHRIGTVGPVFDTVEAKIAGDGEILCRGPIIMKGYWNKPEDTAAALQDGWFHTGDIGSIDPDGHLRITDRKKDVIVTSGGKKVAPQVVEAALKSSPLIQEALVLGEGRKFVAALIVPRNGATREAVAGEVEKVNSGLAQFEQVKRFELIPDDLSIENGMMTPSLKLRRKAVADRHQDLIQKLFLGA
jgi:long-chain acyl-CoA synthetase